MKPQGRRLDQIIPGNIGIIATPPQEGTIVNTIAVDGEPCYATLNTGSSTIQIGPCPYTPRGAVLPKAGNRCLVVTSDEDQPWIACWWPYE